MKKLFQNLQKWYSALLGLLSKSGYMAQKTYRASFDQAFAACLEAIRQCHFFERSSNEQEGTILATTKPSIWSWGEEINIKIVSLKNNINAIKIQSTPKAQLFDWGRSNDNEELLFARLDQLLEVNP